MRTDDECYVGTGPAGEVVGSFWPTLPRATSALHSKSEEGQPTYTELLAQRDELAAALECVLRDHLAVHGVGDVEMQPSLFQARAALSRIKGA